MTNPLVGQPPEDQSVGGEGSGLSASASAPREHPRLPGPPHHIPLDIPSLALQVPDEASAYKLLERLRWDDKPVCPHCGSVAKHYFLTPKAPEGRKTRTGSVSQRRVWKCKDCRKQFSVLTGTIFHGSKVPLRTWLFVVVEMCAAKNGIAAREIERKYNVSTKTAWFMAHRIREAMADPHLNPLVGTIVADETWIGGKPKFRSGTLRGEGGDKTEPKKSVVFSLVNSDTGEARSRVIPNVTADTLATAIVRNVDVDRSRLHTDENQGYKMVGRWFGGGHEAVLHNAHEYVRGDVSTNPAESFFSQLKRSVDGTFHHVSPEHLQRYLNEFDFRHTTRTMNDGQRVRRLMGQTAGRRLSYRPLIGR